VNVSLIIFKLEQEIVQNNSNIVLIYMNRSAGNHPNKRFKCNKVRL